MKRILPASAWQRRDSPLRRAVDIAIPHIRDDIKAALSGLAALIPDNAKDYAYAGDWHSFVRALDWNHFAQVIRSAYGPIGQARMTGARIGVKRINAAFKAAGRPVRYRKVGVGTVVITKDSNDEYAFDLYDSDLLAQLRQAQDDLIAQLSGQVRDTIQTVVERGAQEGLGADDIVDDIRSVISLTAKQAQAVLNYRDSLEQLDQDALERRLRNTSMDDIVQSAMDNGQSLDDAMVDQLVNDYTDNYLDYRADTIAQTESTRAVNYGLQDAYSQAIDRGVFTSDAVRQHWKIDLDENTCPVCRSIPGLNPDGVALDESFQSSDGPVDAPPDPHPNCRCELEIVTNLDLDQVDDSAGD